MVNWVEARRCSKMWRSGIVETRARETVEIRQGQPDLPHATLNIGRTMNLRLNITISLDGYVAGPNQSVTHPLGEGGEELHKWLFAVRTFRAVHGMDGGATGPDDDIATAER